MTELFVPGRLCLLGEHSDWAGAYRATPPALVPGHCLVTGTDQGLHATAEPLANAFVMASLLPDGSRHDQRPGTTTHVCKAPLAYRRRA